MIKRTIPIIIALLILLTAPAQANELHDAVKAEDKVKIEKLLNEGADVNARDSDEITPLFIAAFQSSDGYYRPDNKDIIKLLLDKGADPNMQDKDGNTPLFVLVTGKRVPKDMIELFLNKGANINAKNKDGQTPLQWALVLCDTSDIKFLIAKGANVNTKDTEGNTPLHWAMLFNRQDNFDLLVAKGANINAKNKYGRAPTTMPPSDEEKDSLIKSLYPSSGFGSVQ